MSLQKETTNVLGIPFSKWNMKQTTEWITSILYTPHTELEQTIHIVTANPEIVMNAQEDAKLRASMLAADLITPDGTGVVWAANHLGNPVTERVAGYDMLLEICTYTNQRPFSVYLLGANEEVNQLAAKNLKQRYPQIEIVGRKNGYYHPDDEEAIVRQINVAKPDLLLVALGFPKQELWIWKYKHMLNVKVAIGVGGSFDVLAGKVKRAPQLWRNLRLEWFYRLLSQPSRWRRQLALPKFVLAVRKARKGTS